MPAFQIMFQSLFNTYAFFHHLGSTLTTYITEMASTFIHMIKHDEENICVWLVQLAAFSNTFPPVYFVCKDNLVSVSSWLYVLRCAIWYYLYSLKNVKNTPPWMFYTFFQLYKWYQIAQRTTYNSFSTLHHLVHYTENEITRKWWR